MNDIRNKEDVKLFVDSFYDKVKIDTTIGAVFAARIPSDDWEIHMERMYSFWNTVLFSEQDYQGNPFSKHIGLPIEDRHFSKWIELFKATIDELFQGDKADEAKERADKMGAMFLSKIKYLRDNPNMKPLV